MSRVGLPHQRKMTALSASSDLSLSGLYSDLTITNSAHQRVWKVHKAIVCVRCRFFETCFKHSFKEAQDDVIDLPEDHPDHIDYLLGYLYTYDLEAVNETLTKKSVLTLEDYFTLFAFADKYGQPELRDYWEKNIIAEAGKLKGFDRRSSHPYYSPPIYDEMLKIESTSKQILDIVEFATFCYTCGNSGVETIRESLLAFLARCDMRCRDDTSLLVHMLGGLIQQKPQLGIDLIDCLGKKNLPLMTIMRYQATEAVLVQDTKIMFAVINALTIQPNRG